MRGNDSSPPGRIGLTKCWIDFSAFFHYSLYNCWSSADIFISIILVFFSFLFLTYFDSSFYLFLVFLREYFLCVYSCIIPYIIFFFAYFLQTYFFPILFYVFFLVFCFCSFMYSLIFVFFRLTLVLIFFIFYFFISMNINLQLKIKKIKKTFTRHLGT